MRGLKLISVHFVFIILSFITDWACGDIFTVNNLNDSGFSSLRWAIGQANANPGADIIDFSVSGTIYPTSALPDITGDETIIDASSRWYGTWPGGQPGITLDGSSAGNASGFVINGASRCCIQGLFITSFAVSGIAVSDGSQFNTIGGAGIGSRNVISGNGTDGILIYGLGTDSNVVLGNYVGTDAAGLTGLGNLWCGVRIRDETQFNIIGGKTPGERNIISGNEASGVLIKGSGTDSNLVSGNYIGTDVNGTADLGNSSHGVFISSGAQSNIIGGKTPGERNIISGNEAGGVRIQYPGTDSNVISGNYIGTDATGTIRLGNSDWGASICEGAQWNTIGGKTPGERNIISGNYERGVVIGGLGTNNNVVSGNYIGTDVTGTAALGNLYRGVVIWSEAQANIIGGSVLGERNLISGNEGTGIAVAGSGTDSNVISGNYIGTDVTGAAALGNSWDGVIIAGGARLNTVSENTLAFNTQNGVKVEHTDTDYNKITRNSTHNNAYLGIELEDGGNDEIPAPIITLVALAGDILYIEGTGAGVDATVEIFEADSAVSGEGMTYLGSLAANGIGSFSGDIDITGKGLVVGDPVTSTTIHINNNTSEFTVTTSAGSSIEGMVNIEPDTLNLTSEGIWITCYIELPEEYEVRDIHIDTIRLMIDHTMITQVAESSPSEVSDYDEDGLPDIMVKFDRAIIISRLKEHGLTSGAVALKVIGRVDSAVFEGMDTVNVIGEDGMMAATESLLAPARTPIGPNRSALLQNYPSIFNPDTWIPYQLAEDADVIIRIHDVAGKLIRILQLGHRQAGFHTTKDRAAYWNGTNEAGERVASGIYFYIIQAGKFIATRKMILAK